MTFADVLARAETTEEGRTIRVPETWHQGRTAYGGFSSALALAEAMRIGGDLPPPRSAQMAMMAPLHGEVEVRARVLRSGRNAIWVASEIFGDKGLGFTASFVFMRSVESTVAFDDCASPRGVLAPQDASVLSRERGATFLRHNFDVRFALPPSDERRPEMFWWVRPRDVEKLDPSVALLLTADALPPGVMRLLSPSVPVSTMHWQVNLLTPAPATREGWWLLRTAADYAKEGCSSQRMALWNVDGAPMLTGMQSIALFG
ncbi:thioesterase family protein [Novosphingobium sp. RD2P27]|uniref:Thioesterase family protein n=1 Tax=Novosphingobium kalidii TaxID=3230299 RepID=A0ABV2D2T9_9SPHN